MQRLRVVDCVQADRLRVVVDGDINRAANGLLDAGASATAAGEQIHGQLAVDGQEELRSQHAVPPSFSVIVTGP